MKWIIKFFKWLFSGGRCLEAAKRDISKIYSERNNIEAERIFAEIDNDLINQIDKAAKDFRQAQLKHIPCQMMYYSKFEIKCAIANIRLFLIKRNRIIQGGSIMLECGDVIEAGSWHENTKYIKYKGK